VELEEAETGELRRFSLSAADVQRYTQAYDAFTEELRLAALARRITFDPCSTDEPFEERFLQLLTRISALS
jgi:hypothetical protein